jgi:hypothetical protein
MSAPIMGNRVTTDDVAAAIVFLREARCGNADVSSVVYVQQEYRQITGVRHDHPKR